MWRQKAACLCLNSDRNGLDNPALCCPLAEQLVKAPLKVSNALFTSL